MSIKANDDARLMNKIVKREGKRGWGRGLRELGGGELMTLSKWDKIKD